MNDNGKFTVYSKDKYIEMEIYRVKKDGANWQVHFPRFEFSGLYQGTPVLLGTINEVLCFLFAYDKEQAEKFKEWLRNE